jgi:hypothetical protein
VSAASVATGYLDLAGGNITTTTAEYQFPARRVAYV